MCPLAAVAQLVECHLVRWEVSGSILKMIQGVIKIFSANGVTTIGYPRGSNINVKTCTTHKNELDLDHTCTCKR